LDKSCSVTFFFHPFPTRRSSDLGDSADSLTQCAQPAGYVLDNTDCDDTNDNEYPGQTWFVDADGDGYGASSVTACERPTNGFLLSELSGNGNDDCDDTDDNEHLGQTWYVDADGDGYGASSVVACERPTNGFLLSELTGNGTDDCDDTDDALNPDTVWYADTDGDGYGDSADSLTQCVQPAGY